jgi:hypothetical protein
VDGIYKLKVPDGKLVIAKVSYSDKIERVQILGDFFIYPEESLSLIENMLVGSMINSTKDEIAAQIEALAAKQHIEMVGVTPDAMAQAIAMAMK